MSRRLPKKSKRSGEAREQAAHDKVISTQGSGASSLERRERPLEAVQETSRRSEEELLHDLAMAPAKARSRMNRRVGETPGFARLRRPPRPLVGGLRLGTPQAMPTDMGELLQSCFVSTTSILSARQGTSSAPQARPSAASLCRTTCRRPLRRPIRARQRDRRRAEDTRVIRGAGLS